MFWEKPTKGAISFDGVPRIPLINAVGCQIAMRSLKWGYNRKSRKNRPSYDATEIATLKLIVVHFEHTCGIS